MEHWGADVGQAGEVVPLDIWWTGVADGENELWHLHKTGLPLLG